MLPNWLLGMWPSASGPFTLYRNGEPVLRRDGSVQTQTSAARFKLPMCRACNGVLDQRFERPAKPLIRRIFNAGPALDPSEAELVGRWFVKTWLLLARPELQVSDPGYEPTPWVPLEPSLYEWMTVEPPTPTPTGLSAWLVKIDREGRPAAATRHIALPTVVADGSTVQFRAFRFGLGWLDVSLVHHPLWAISHPLEAEGRAARLWPPSPTTGLEVGGLPLVGDREMSWLTGPTVHFQPDTYGKIELPPLSATTDFMTDLEQAVQMVVG